VGVVCSHDGLADEVLAEAGIQLGDFQETDWNNPENQVHSKKQDRSVNLAAVRSAEELAASVDALVIAYPRPLPGEPVFAARPALIAAKHGAKVVRVRPVVEREAA
jgi:hypothetical protein